MPRLDRPQLARRRIYRILQTYTVAGGRTLEQKIADAGPGHLRVDPHVLTEALRDLLRLDFVRSLPRDGAPWYYVATTPLSQVEARLTELVPIHHAMAATTFGPRAGQALEIAVFRGLIAQTELGFLGHFTDLDAHDDAALYSKVEPPLAISGRRITGGPLDFVLGDLASPVGVEVKNVRPWLYPQHSGLKAFLSKCCQLNAVPVLIARRVPWVTFKLLHPCGVLLHQTYNQRFPNADAELARKAADKSLLGYHDIRVGNDPDARLTKFIRTLPTLIAPARARFENFKDILCPYAHGQTTYKEFAARIRRRLAGTSEDSDEE